MQQHQQKSEERSQWEERAAAAGGPSRWTPLGTHSQVADADATVAESDADEGITMYRRKRQTDKQTDRDGKRQIENA